MVRLYTKGPPYNLDPAPLQVFLPYPTVARMRAARGGHWDARGGHTLGCYLM